MFRRTILKNGLRIITVPMKNTQTVTVLVLVGTGSKYEKKELNGISHFLEHMYFKGTKKRPSPMAVAEPVDRAGGVYNAFTSQEYTGYFVKIESSKFKIALDWVSDIFLNSVLPEKEIEKEKGVITEEINMIYDHPMIYIGYLWTKLLYGDQPAGWNIAGTKESVAELNRSKLLDYMKKQYVASNTILCLSGNIETEKAVSLAKKYFSEIKTGKIDKKPRVVDASIKTSAEQIRPELTVEGLSRMPSTLTLSRTEGIKIQNSPQILLDERKTDQAHLVLGVRGFNLFHPQRYAQEILGTILGGMKSSRLFVEIRDKLGLAYYISTDSEEDQDTGFLVTQAGVDNQRAEKAISTILKEYKKMAQKKISNFELKKAKDNIKGKLAILLETSDAKASFYAGQELLEKKILPPKEIFEKIDKVTADDIIKVARDIFKTQKLNLALIGPFKEKERFEKLLKL